MDFTKDMFELTEEQRLEHKDLVEMIRYVYKCYHLILGAG